MKKRIMALISIALLSILLAGCGTSSREQELEKKVEQLEQQITDMQGTTDNADTSNTADATANSSTANSATGSSDSNTTANAITDINDFDTLSQKVADAVANVDAAKPTGTAEESRSLFFERKTALDALDRELDAYEDALEAQYRNGTLNYADFRKQDREVEKLEDALDDAEDRLENRFGIDD